MTKKDLLEALEGLPNDTHISVWQDHDIYDTLEVDVMTAWDPLPCHDPVVHINIHEDPKNAAVNKADMQKVQQALMLAEMFFIATPIDTIEKMGNPLGKVLSEAVGITLKYTD